MARRRYHSGFLYGQAETHVYPWVTARDKPDRVALKLKAIKYLGGVCIDCKTMPHHAAMEFHHTDPKNKTFNISGRLTGSSWTSILEELDKCT